MPTAFFELEMTSEQIAARALAVLSGITTEAQQRGNFDKDGWNSLWRAHQRLERLPLYLHAEAGLTLSALTRHCRRLRRRGELGLVVLDHSTCNNSVRRPARGSPRKSAK